MIHGTVAPEFQPVADALAAQLASVAPARAGGAAVCVYYRGRAVVDIWAGARDAAGNPWRADTAALSFSTTKGVVATLVHRLVDRGLVDYDQPVARYWPEFAAGGKEAVTVRQVLSHQAGLHAIRPLIDHADRMLDWDVMTRALASARPRRDPHGRTSYHALTYGWLAGELVRRVTGRTVDEALQGELATPLALDGAFIGAPVGMRHRLAELILPASKGAMSRLDRAKQEVARLALRGAGAMLGLDPTHTRDAILPRGARDVFYSPRVLDAEIPAMNGVFTARSLARIYAMLAGGGVLEGKRLLSSATLERAAQIQSRTRDSVVGFPMRWRLGYHLVGTTRGVLPRAFGHFGYGGSGAWADPERDLAVAMTLNRVAGTPFGDGRMLRIGTIAARCADRVLAGERRRPAFWHS